MFHLLFRDLHSHLVGYKKMPRASSSPTTLARLPEQHTIAEPSGSNVASSVLSVVPGRPGTSNNPTSAIPIAFAPPHLSVPAGTGAPTAHCMPGAHIIQAGQTSSHPMEPGTDLAETRKRKNEAASQMDSCKRPAVHNLEGNNQVSLCCIVTALVHPLPLDDPSWQRSSPPATSLT